MVDDKKNIPDAGKAGESPKPEKAEPVKADSPVHDQPAPAKAGVVIGVVIVDILLIFRVEIRLFALIPLGVLA